MRSIAPCIAAVLLTVACGGDDDDHGGHEAPGDDGAPADRDAAATDDGAGPATSCEAYCDLVTAACLDPARQYHDRASCLATCALFPPGAPGDESGNSLACRVHHAELAAGDPDPHCYHAGPSGGPAEVCGGACESYCAIMLATCPDEYAGEAECMETCAAFPDPGTYSTLESRTDTVACRLFHATRATTDDGHCGSARADSAACSE